MKINGKPLRQIIEENKKSITTGKVFIAYSPETQLRTGKDGYFQNTSELSESSLNFLYTDREWWIEDGDLCVSLYK